MKRPVKYQRLPWHDLQETLETWGVFGYLVLAAVVASVVFLVMGAFL